MAETAAATRADLPQFVNDVVDAFLECGIMIYGFPRLRCGDGHDKPVGFSCKRRSSCSSCCARRMAQTAAHLVDHVIPHVPVPSGCCRCRSCRTYGWTAQPKLVAPVL